MDRTKGLERRGLDKRRRTGRALRPGGVPSVWLRLVDDDHLGGLLARIRAVAGLIGLADGADPAQVRTAAWLIEALADEAYTRLSAAVHAQRLGRAAGRRP